MTWKKKGDKPWTSLWTESKVKDVRENRPNPVIQEKPDLILDLSCDNPTAFQSVIIATFHNQKLVLADRVRYTFEIWNQRAFIRGILKESPGFKPGIDDLTYEFLDKVGSGAYIRIDSFALPDQWIKGQDKFDFGPINPHPQFLKALKLGDPIVGTATLTCANCERSRGYWIFFKVGVGGWFAETADDSEPSLRDDLLRGVRDKGEKERQNFFINPEPYLATRPILKKQPICPR